MAWDTNTGNGMANGTDGAFEQHLYGDDPRRYAQQVEALDAEAESIAKDQGLLAEALADYAEPASMAEALAACALKRDAESLRSARKFIAQAIAAAAWANCATDLLDKRHHQGAVARWIADEVLP